MLKQKTVLLKNKRGNIVRIIREHYLRDDICCSYPACGQCPEDESNQFMLFPDAEVTVDGNPCVFICDSTIAIYQMDILEHPSVTNYVILYTVLDEVRDKNLPLYSRLRSCATNKSKNFYVFPNEYQKDLYVERVEGETNAQRNQRAVIMAVEWYTKHLQMSNVSVVLVSTDDRIRSTAINKGLLSMDITEYADLMKAKVPELSDMVAPVDDGKDQGKQIYSEYITKTQIQAGLKAGLLYQGKLDISAHNVFEGSIYTTINGKERKIQISGKMNLNRSINEDNVVIELLPRAMWKQLEGNTEINENGEQEDSDKDEPADDMQVDDEVKEISDDDTPYGKVVGIIRRNWRTYAGVIDPKSAPKEASTTASVWFYPVDRKIPRIRIKTRQLDRLMGQKILVAVDKWSTSEAFPSGHFVRSLGQSGDKSTEMEALLLEHDVPFQPFSQAILNELPPEGDSWVVRDELHLEGREDLRGIQVCSIDPPGCTDIDDALHCRPLPNGNYECGVHIADVSFFVKPEMKMDEEAAKRGTTVYLVDKRLDMLPSLLGTNLCSLKSNVDRLAFSCIWELDADANIISVRYTKSIIKSVASFTYAEAQLRLDDVKQKDPLTQSIRNLNRFAKILKEKRRKNGSIMLSSPEVRFKLEHDSQDPVDVELKDLKETNSLVEEFMLLANISVAQEIFNKFPEVAVLRRHPKPEVTNFEALNKQLEFYKIKLSVETSKALSQSLDAAQVSEDKYFNNLVRILTTRCMMQAKYFCSGSFSYEDFRHYGLATEIYTHFTSPIRRYADILVHRLLHACIDPSQVVKMPSLFDRVKISEVCDNINFRHTMAQQAARSSVILYTNLFFRGKEVVEQGYVTRVLKNGVGVLIPKYGIEGFVYTTNDETKESVMDYDADNFTLSSSDVTLRVFSKVTVMITIDEGSISGLRQRLRMRFIEPKIEGL